MYKTIQIRSDLTFLSYNV